MSVPQYGDLVSGALQVIHALGRNPKYGPSALRRHFHGLGVDEPLVWCEGADTSDRRWMTADDERGSIIASTTSQGGSTTINTYDE